MMSSVQIQITSWHFSAILSAADNDKTLFQILFLSYPVFPSTKTSPVGLAVMTMMGTGYVAGRNQSRSQYTVIKFPTPHAKFPFASSSFSFLHFSTPLLPLSSSASPSPLLSFPSTFLDIWSSGDTQVTVFTAWPAQCCIHSFLPCFLPRSLLSPPCPLHLLLDYSLELILPWHTLSRQKKETLSDCLDFQRSMIPHKGTLCVCVCVLFQLWSEILRMRQSLGKKGTNWK